VQQNSPTGWKVVGDEIHVWRAILDREEDFRNRLAATLSPDEKARAERFHFERDRNHYIVARGTLRELLAKYLGRAPGELAFSYGDQGKPSLAEETAAGGLCFNVSHSHGLVVYAIARGRNLGIDVELVHAESASEEIARRYFSDAEVNELLSLPPAARAEGFFNCWTRKEAYLKARGFGLQIPLDSFSVSLIPGRAAALLSGVEPGWHLSIFCPAQDYVAAVVYDGDSSVIQHFSVDSDLE
jgi:4'-phosphopantetheinyl transferase